MKVTRDKIENRQVFLTIEMEPAEVEEWLEKAYRRLSNKVNVPGFRRGKAPRELLERHIGKEHLFEEALNKMVPEAYRKAIDEQKIEPFAQPEIEVTKTDPVVFTATVPIPPVVELGDYHSIKVEPKPVEVTEDHVSTTIEQIRHEHATWEPVERPLDFGDLVVMDVKGIIDSRPVIDQPGSQYPVVKDSIFPAPGFAEQLIGMKMGDEKEFKLHYPSEYPRPELAGKEALFKVNVKEVKQENLPELSDAFAREIGPEFETVDMLKEKVSERLKFRAEEIARDEFEQQVVEAVVEQAKIEFPPVLVEEEIDHLLRDHLRRNRMRVEDLEENLRQTNKSAEQLRDDLRPVATKRVKQSLVLDKAAEAEGVAIGDSEVDSEIDKMVERAAEKKEELRKLLNSQQSRQSMKNSLILRKTVERLAEIAKDTKEKVDTVEEGGKNG